MSFHLRWTCVHQGMYWITTSDPAIWYYLKCFFRVSGTKSWRETPYGRTCLLCFLASEHCIPSYFAIYYCDKDDDLKSYGKEMIYFSLQAAVHVKGSRGRNSRQEPRERTREEHWGNTAYWLVPMAYSVFSVQPRMTWLGCHCLQWNGSSHINY